MKPSGVQNRERIGKCFVVVGGRYIYSWPDNTQPISRSSPLFIGCFLFDEILGGLFADCVDVTDFVLELDSVALVCHFHQLGSEGRRDELGIVRQSMDHGCVGGERMDMHMCVYCRV